jgi:hypothetical protein
MPSARRKPRSDVSTKPQEIKSDFDLQIGKHVTLKGSASISPRGVLCAGVAVALMAVALGFLVSSSGRRSR